MDTGIRERGARKGRDGHFGCGAREGNTIPLHHCSLGTHQQKGHPQPPLPPNSSSQVINNQSVESFDSRGHHLYKFIETKESVYIWKEFNSHKRGLEHQPPT